MNPILEWLSKRMEKESKEQERKGFTDVMYAYYKEGKSIDDMRQPIHKLLSSEVYTVSYNLGAREAVRIIDDMRKDQMALLAEVSILKPKHTEAITRIKQNKRRIVT